MEYFQSYKQFRVDNLQDVCRTFQISEKCIESLANDPKTCERKELKYAYEKCKYNNDCKLLYKYFYDSL